ncbi:unnamed protein product [Lampetra fluviatilis]
MGVPVNEPLGTGERSAMAGEDGARHLQPQPQTTERWREVAGRLDRLLTAVAQLSLRLGVTALSRGAIWPRLSPAAILGDSWGDAEPAPAAQ